MKEKISIFLNRDLTYFLFYAVLLLIALSRYYSNGALILGGEGNRILNFSNHLNKYGFMWFSAYGFGILNMLPSGTGLNVLLLWFVELITKNREFVNFIQMFLIYFLPFLGMYLAVKQIIHKKIFVFVCAFFYIANPFMLYYLTCMNQWNIFSMTAMPFFLWIILKYYHNNFKLFFYFGLISACLSFAYTNPPMLVVIHIVMLLLVFLSNNFHVGKINFCEIAKKYSIVLFSFIIFNFWWILAFFGGGVLVSAKDIYSPTFANSWLNTTVSDAGPIVWKQLLFTGIIGTNSSYDFFVFWYGLPFMKIILHVPLLIVVYFVLISKDKRTHNKFVCSIFLGTLIVLFFMKGNSGMFGFIYAFLFKFLPFFYIFKTPVEKFGLLYIFSFTVLFAFVIKGLSGQKYSKQAFIGLAVYLVCCAMPFLTGNILPDTNIDNTHNVSRKFKEKEDYRKLRAKVDKDESIYRILSFPSVGNYQILMPSGEDKFYTGLDPLLDNVNKSFIAGSHSIDILYKNISQANYLKILSMYNIGRIVINEDLIPWFGKKEKESVEELKGIFAKTMPMEKWGPITTYRNVDNFIPLIYTSD